MLRPRCFASIGRPVGGGERGRARMIERCACAMSSALRKQARTTPAVRAEIAASRKTGRGAGATLQRHRGHHPQVARARRLLRPSPHCPSPANHAHARLRRRSRSICVVSGRPVGRDARVCLPERVALWPRPLSAPARGGQSAQPHAPPESSTSSAKPWAT